MFIVESSSSSRCICIAVALAIAVMVAPALAAEHHVSARGKSLQQLLNDAAPGDTITLTAGATYVGNFILPEKSGTGWITIRSSSMQALPPAGRRIDPSYEQHMAKLVSPDTRPVLATSGAAHHYRIMGVELTVRSGVYSNGLVLLGSGSENAVAALPHSFEFDRVYIHGDPEVGGKRGIALNSRSTTIVNSWISDFKSTSQDSQAICGWNGDGPYQITNNYIEAAGENIMFGGATARIPDLVPSDITVRRNHICKPLSWKFGDPSFAGTRWAVKNLFELKNARRVMVDANVFENNWVSAQAGMSIVLTVRTQGGAMPWAVVEDVTFTNNIIRNVAGGFNISGQDGPHGGSVNRIMIKNNICEGVRGRFLQLLNAANHVVVDRNTIQQTSLLISLDGRPSSGLVFQNNLAGRGSYGIFGSGKQEGTASLAFYAPDSVVTNNVIAGAPQSKYPTGNFFPAVLPDIPAGGVEDTAAVISSERTRRPDDRGIGADIDTVKAATAGVVTR